MLQVINQLVSLRSDYLLLLLLSSGCSEGQPPSITLVTTRGDRATVLPLPPGAALLRVMKVSLHSTISMGRTVIEDKTFLGSQVGQQTTERS